MDEYPALAHCPVTRLSINDWSASGNGRYFLDLDKKKYILCLYRLFLWSFLIIIYYYYGRYGISLDSQTAFWLHYITEKSCIVYSHTDFFL